MTARRRVLIVAGEASGDLHGANLVKAFREQEPDVEFFGLGGERMRAAGVDVVFDSSLVAVVGASEVLANLTVILRVLRWLNASLTNLRPDLVILIDFPDFNFRVAKAAKAANVPVFYYISPQIWAWRRGRAKFLAKTVEGIAVIFPFEEDLYKQWGLPAEFVGHPLMDGPFGAPPDKARARAALGLKESDVAIALLPGSRKSEIENHLDITLASAERIAREIPGAVFLLPVAHTLDAEWLKQRAGTRPIALRFVSTAEGEPRDVLMGSDYAVVKSGTSTVEAALAGVPFVIVYRLSALTFALGRLVVKVPFIGMANLIAGRQVARELVQRDFTPENVAAEIVSLHRDSTKRDAAKAALAEVRAKMGEGGASRRAAAMAAGILGRRAPPQIPPNTRLA